MATIHYACKKCNYKFKRKEEAKAIACPYCGSRNIDEYKPTTVEDLLKNTD